MSSFDIGSLITRINPFSKRMKKETTVILIVVIAMASFFGFYPLFAEFKEPAAQAFAAAIFGTIFTIVLTMFLLKTQTEVAETSERNQVVFQEKLKLFKGIISKMKSVFKDGNISKDEMPEFQFILLELNMLAEKNTITCFRELYDGILKTDPDQENFFVTSEHRNKLLEFTTLCRKELRLTELTSIKQEAILLEEMKETSEKTDERSITYSGWDAFEKSQSADSRKEPFIPIAKAVHDLIIETLNAAKLKPEIDYEINYGGGTFSFKVHNAKDRKKVFARFGLLSLREGMCYIESLYKDANVTKPDGAMLSKKDDPTQYSYRFTSLDDFEKVKKDLKEGIVRSYNILAISPVKP